MSALPWCVSIPACRRRPGTNARAAPPALLNLNPEPERSCNSGRGFKIMATVLIQNGTIVNADSTVKADLLIEGTTIKEIRAGIPASSADTVVDARWPVAAARRHRCAHSSRYALWRLAIRRRFPDRHARRGHRRNNDHCRLRHSGARHQDALRRSTPGGRRPRARPASTTACT